jgi:hypothetical protein
MQYTMCQFYLDVGPLLDGYNSSTDQYGYNILRNLVLTARCNEIFWNPRWVSNEMAKSLCIANNNIFCHHNLT